MGAAIAGPPPMLIVETDERDVTKSRYRFLFLLCLLSTSPITKRIAGSFLTHIIWSRSGRSYPGVSCSRGYLWTGFSASDRPTPSAIGTRELRIKNLLGSRIPASSVSSQGGYNTEFRLKCGRPAQYSGHRYRTQTRRALPAKTRR